MQRRAICEICEVDDVPTALTNAVTMTMHADMTMTTMQVDMNVKRTFSDAATTLGTVASSSSPSSLLLARSSQFTFAKRVQSAEIISRIENSCGRSSGAAERKHKTTAQGSSEFRGGRTTENAIVQQAVLGSIEHDPLEAWCEQTTIGCERAAFLPVYHTDNGLWGGMEISASRASVFAFGESNGHAAIGLKPA